MPIDAEAEEYVHGPPRVALGIAKSCSRSVFIEGDAARVAEPEQLRQEYGER